MTDTSAPVPKAGAKQWWGLAILVIPSTLLFMMLTILFLAAPNLAADLNPTSTQLLWILDIYGFVMAGFLVAMGVLGDRVGKRLLMVVGAILFAAVSIAAALTTIPELMIVWRAVLGLGCRDDGAGNDRPDLRALRRREAARRRDRRLGWRHLRGRRARPVAQWSALLEGFGWQATFLVAVPIMAIVAIGAPILVPEHKDPTARIDLFSALPLVGGLLAIIYGIKRFAAQEPAGPSIGLLVAGVLIGLWFVIRRCGPRSRRWMCACSPTAPSPGRWPCSFSPRRHWVACTRCSPSTSSRYRGSRRSRPGCRSCRPRRC